MPWTRSRSLVGQIAVRDLVTWSAQSSLQHRVGDIWKVTRMLELLGVAHCELQNVDTDETKIIAVSALRQIYKARVVDAESDGGT